MEIDSLKRVLQHVEQRRAIYGQIDKEQQMETQLGLSMMCELAGVSRAGYYRLLHPDKAGARRPQLRNDIQNTRAG